MPLESRVAASFARRPATVSDANAFICMYCVQIDCAVFSHIIILRTNSDGTARKLTAPDSAGQCDRMVAMLTLLFHDTRGCRGLGASEIKFAKPRQVISRAGGVKQF